MKVSPYIRIQWFHDELTRKTYPNAARLSERFDISVRQAQRDNFPPDAADRIIESVTKHETA